MKNNKWKTISEEPEGEFRIFTMREVVAKSPRTGKNHKFVLLDCSDWVNIIAITVDKKIVMVKQYRFGTSNFELEIP